MTTIFISVLEFAAPGEFDPSAMGVGLRGLMSRVQLRRRRAEVLDHLPPKFAAVIGLDLTATQRAAYRQAEEKGTVWLRSLGRELRISHVLELILRLKQICNFCPETGELREAWMLCAARLEDSRRPTQRRSSSPNSSRNHSACGNFAQGIGRGTGRWPILGGMDQPSTPR